MAIETTRDTARTDVRDARNVLRRVWGYDGFRPGQREAVAAVLSGRDALAVLPTGGGKSICYQVPPLAQGGMALVVSPLIALMQDQVDALLERGVKTAFASGRLSHRQTDQLWTNAEFGRYQVLYVTPERLLTDMFRARAARLPVRLLAVDEAHCISEWGHDFRPAYRRIAEVRELLRTPEGNTAPVLAVTATATPEVRADIREQLELHEPETIVQGFDRPNLIFAVRTTENKLGQVRRILENVPGPGLLYAGTRKATEQWARKLARMGISAQPYHAGLDGKARTAVQQAWLKGDIRYVVATSAFGMGIDKPDVRVVVHTALPLTLEGYYQEAGRAGRDGERAYAVLVIGPGDEALPEALHATTHLEPGFIQAVYEAAGSLAQVAIGAQPDEPTVIDPDRLAESLGAHVTAVRTAIGRIVEAGAWDLLPERDDFLYLHLTASPDTLRHYATSQRSSALKRFVSGLLRSVRPEAYTKWMPVSLSRLMHATELPETRVTAGLHFLEERGLLRSAHSGMLVRWSHPRSKSVALDGGALKQARRRAEVRLGHVKRYIAAPGCRRQYLLSYFGEAAPAQCGRCDQCLKQAAETAIGPEAERDLRKILRAAGQERPREMWLPNASAARKEALVDWLLREGLLGVDPITEEYFITPRGNKAAGLDLKSRPAAAGKEGESSGSVTE